MPKRPRQHGSDPDLQQRFGQGRPRRAGRPDRPPQRFGKPGGGPPPTERPHPFKDRDRDRDLHDGPGSVPHLAPTGQLAERAVEAAEQALANVFERHASPAWSQDSFRTAHRQAPWSWLDAWFVDGAVRSLFRWWGWIGPLEGLSTAERLLLATLMDSGHVHPVVRFWAKMAGRETNSLMPLGDAPTWTAKTDGFKRLTGRKTPMVDPWRLFPPWFREAIVLPPGSESAKVRAVSLIEALQKPAPLWVRSQGAEPEVVWNELRALGLKPWVHRKISTIARIEAELDLEQIPAFVHGRLEQHDYHAQAIAPICAPLPGQRWWVTHAGSSVEHIHLAALMNGRGVVVATDGPGTPRKSIAVHARRTPFRNITTREWTGKHTAGKQRSFDGVLTEPPSSGVGQWGKDPVARWLLRAETRARLAKEQLALLTVAGEGVRPGGFLVYAVPTFTTEETTGLVTSFLKAHPEFQLDPFPDPFEGGKTTGQLQLYPSATIPDGLFIASFIRKSTPGSTPQT